MTQLYTASRLRVLRDCIQRHYYQYVLNIRTASTPQAEFGTVLHAALEAYLVAWKEGRLDYRLDAALAAIGRSTLGHLERSKLRVLVVAYHLRWGSEPWTVLAVEQEFRYELDDVLIGGKLDGLVRNNETGRTYVLEHKSTGADVTPGSPYWQKLTLDSQVSIYIDGASMLGHEIDGCIYDVIKRPEHELKSATPADKRQYTLGKGCSKCGGSAGGKKGVVQGRGHYDVVFASEVKRNACEGCSGTGWKLDDEGQPQAPRLYSNQRDTDETLDEFEDRLTTEIGERVDEFLIRNVVVRLDSELPRMREDLLASIALERVTSATKLYVRNVDACARYGGMCPFFAACSGTADIDDQILFPRAERSHPELASAA